MEIRGRSDSWSHHFKRPFMLEPMASDFFGPAVWMFFGDINRKFGFL